MPWQPSFVTGENCTTKDQLDNYMIHRALYVMSFVFHVYTVPYISENISRYRTELNCIQYSQQQLTVEPSKKNPLYAQISDISCY